MLDAKNVDSKLSADIQFAYAFPDPAFWYFHPKNGVLLGERAVRTRLADASSRLPSVHTDSPLFDLYYKRSILTVLESTWRRDDYVLNPFYSCGTWMSTLAWDTSFSSKMLAMTEPEGLKQAIRAYVGSDVLRSSYINYLGNNPPHAYLQTLFAAIQTVDDYILITGDREKMCIRDRCTRPGNVFTAAC